MGRCVLKRNGFDLTYQKDNERFSGLSLWSVWINKNFEEFFFRSKGCYLHKTSLSGTVYSPYSVNVWMYF